MRMMVMSSGRRGFAPIVVIGIIALIALGAAGFFSYPRESVIEDADVAVAPVVEMHDIDDGIVEVQEAPSENTRKVVATEPRSSETPTHKSQDKEKADAPDAVRGMGESFDMPFVDSSSAAQMRSGWEILSEKERAQLPECKSELMTVSPVPFASIVTIEPIGSANPPEHTLASISSDTYIAVPGQGTTATTPLVAPGDMWIILVQPRYGVTQDPEDHVIKYAFCKDIYGVVDHVKSFSPEMQRIVETHECSYPSNTSEEKNCPILLLERVVAGTPLGTVGRMQGNFNFGTWDLRVTHKFISSWRHGHLTKHSTCPFDYFSSPLKEQLMAKLEKTAAGACGTVEHDVAGTLAGDWFVGDATPMRHEDWGKMLHFGSSNMLSGQSVISISGMFVEQPTKWVFTANAFGDINREFKEVTPGSIYCYDNDGNHQHRNYERGVRSGKIIVQMTSATELQIEHQDGLCQGTNWGFKKSTRYQR